MSVESPPLVNVHWRARLAEIQDCLLVAHSVDDVVKTCLALTNVLSDEWAQRPDADAVQLVIEAYDLLTNPETTVDLKDWLKAAGPVVRR